ncbi:MAG: hypothetical protein GXO94_04515, partial [Nitrospirae bacterium]|nr:hypothetical protein [Nitrospirota bacterium]
MRTLLVETVSLRAFLVCFLVILAWTGVAEAVVAAPVTRILSQPDGTEFRARQWGDEREHG